MAWERISILAFHAQVDIDHSFLLAPEITEPSKDLEDVSSATDSDIKLSDLSDHEESPVKALPKPQTPVHTPEIKPRKLVALTYNYSDSEDDETREERKARMVRLFFQFHRRF